jgi:integrase
MLKESNVRLGFLESAGYTRLAEECGRVGLWMRALLECGYTHGWRHEELIELRYDKWTLAGAIRLDPGTTKNDQGREVSMTGTVLQLLGECIRGKHSEDHVFTREGRTPVREFRATWSAICCAAEVGELLCRSCDEPVDPGKHCASCGRDWTRHELKYRGLIFHDLRRTSVRNMVRAGVSERLAMSISGHKTRAISTAITSLRRAISATPHANLR